MGGRLSDSHVAFGSHQLPRCNEITGSSFPAYQHAPGRLPLPGADSESKMHVCNGWQCYNVCKCRARTLPPVSPRCLDSSSGELAMFITPRSSLRNNEKQMQVR